MTRGPLTLTRDPRTVVRGRRVLTPTGRLLTLREGASLDSPALRDRLLDVGALHPVPEPLPVDDVTVVVPVRDRADELARCLAALEGLDVLVVDDGSSVPAVGPRVVRRPNGGPAAARNTAIPLLHRDVVAFVDSDVTVTRQQLEQLRGHFADPAVVAVAPRVQGTHRSPLDLGPRPASVRPGGAVSYVPTACLLVRVAALHALSWGSPVGAEPPACTHGASPQGAPFDEALRYGEDVDLVWRLVDAGGVVRYDPSVVVRHEEPARLTDRLRRRFAYGTSAAPLSERHPDRLAHLVLPPWPTAAVAAVLAKPRLAPLAVLALAVRAHRQVGDPVLTAHVTARALRSTALGLGRAGQQLGPVTWPLAARHPRLALLLLLPTLLDRTSPLDSAAYGAGVVAGCVRHRTTKPLRPRRP